MIMDIMEQVIDNAAGQGSHMDSESKCRPYVRDRISELPEEVLTHLLSYLPTKYSVRTSVLSTKWKNIWASVPDLDICDEATADITGFMAFADRVMNSPQSNIRKFRLHCSSFGDHARIQSWVCRAVQRNVVEVDLCVESAQRYTFELPQPLIVSKTLEVLKLDSNYEMHLPLSGSFPSLKCLHITVDSPDNDAMRTLISFCPVLEDLIIDGTLGKLANSVTVYAAKLKNLRIRLRRSSGSTSAYVVHNISINAPKLEYIDIEEDDLSKYTCNTKSLVKAHAYVSSLTRSFFITRSPGFHDRVTALLSAVSNVKYLSLSAGIVRDICAPTYGSLSHLNLQTICCNYGELQHLLERMPNLEYLFLKYNRISIWEYSETPRSVPTCLTSHLKNISIRGFEGERNGLKLLQYLLRNGEVLEKMTIYVADPCYTKRKFRKKISMFGKGSTTCEVEYILA